MKAPRIAPQQRDIVIEIWKQTLAVSEIDLDRGFADLGGTSLSANRFVSELERRLGVNVPVMRVFEYPTLRMLLRYLIEGVQTSPSSARPARTRSEVAVPEAVRGGHDIAIVGMACRFPGARNIDEFWANLLDGRDTITILSGDQLSPAVPPELRDDPRYVRAAGLIDQPYGMDAEFFGMNPMEAKLTDPQQRVLLETAWQALEHAGEAVGRLPERTAVYAGTEDNSYYRSEIVVFPEAERRAGRFAVMTGNEKDYVAMRIAHKLNLKGPAVSVHTACSTSLVAVIMACKSLRYGECDLALAGGASVHFPTPEGYHYQKGGVFSSDGHSRPFDRAAQGTNFTDGSGMVVLKRIEDAIRDRNTIFAVIKGGAINSDGGEKASFSAPSVTGQANCIRDALADAAIDAGTIQYVEAHGTATPVGDPVEVQGLRLAFASRKEPEKLQYCGIGSVKSNIGHTTAAAGVAGLIKTALALRHGVIPATVHFTSPNPALDLESSPFYVVGSKLDWPRSKGRRRAGLSSFGIGGTNSHVVLEEAPALEEAERGVERPFEIWPVSAKSLAQRDRLVAGLTAERYWPRDIAHTLQYGRARFRHRGARVRLTQLEAEDLLVQPSQQACEEPRVAFMFPGQGSQYIEMGKSLYEQLPEFRATFERCCQVLSEQMGMDFKSFIFDPANRETLEDTRYTQPALFAIEVSLGRMLVDWGIEPEWMIGHSVGEFVAAHLANVFSLEDALRLIATRGRLMAGLPRGRMLAVRGELEAVLATAAEPVDIASLNSPIHCVLSGSNEQIARVEQKLETAGIACRPLHTSHAFHSAMMETVVAPFLEFAQSVTLRAPERKIVSTASGELLTAAQATDPHYWAGHLRNTVKFSPALFRALELGANVLLEAGPRTTLTSLAVQHFASATKGERVAIAMLADSPEAQAEIGGVGVALAKLWCAGVELEWQKIWSGGRKAPLASTYPFERKDYRFSEGRQAQLRSVRESEPETAPEPKTSGMSALERTELNGEDPLTAELARLLAECSGLNIDQLDATFLELGFDSLLMMRIATQLAERYGVAASLSDLMFKVNTLKRLSEFVLAQADSKKLRNRAPEAAAKPAEPEPTLALPDGGAQGAKEKEPSGKPLLRAKQAQPVVGDFGDETAIPSTRAMQEIFHASLDCRPASRAFNQSISIFLEGELDRDALYSALLNLLDRHEALRGRFSADGTEFLVRERIAFELPLIDLRNLAATAQETALDELMAKEVEHVFDLLEGPLFRAFLVARGERDHVLVFNCHHAIVDGWSLKIILAELPRLYSDLAQGRVVTELPASASYVEYARLAAGRERDMTEKVRSYWRQVFAGGAPKLELPLDDKRPLLRNYESLREDFYVNQQAYDGLKAAGAKNGLSQFVTLLSAFALYIGRIAGQNDFVIGVPSSGQIANGKSELLGHDSRILPIRFEIREEDTFVTFAKRTMERFLAGYEHQWITLPEVLQAIDFEVEKSRAPLVQVTFSYDPGMDEGALTFKGLKARHFFNLRSAETFEIAVNCVVENNELILEWAYNQSLFDPLEMHFRLKQFEQLMASIAAQPHSPVGTLPVVPQAQISEMDASLNSTAMEFERGLCTDQLIERTVRERPDKIAVEWGSERLTYEQLWRRSGEVAAALLREDLGPLRLAGVMMERSADMVAVLLGVWRAGAAYVPMDPAYPMERLDYMIEHSGMRVLLTQGEIGWNPKRTVRAIDVGDLEGPGGNGKLTAPHRLPSDLAYVIYTSGSTGKPKGVQIPHSALVNFLTTMRTQQPGIAEHDRLLAVTTLSFDIAGLELWLPLLVGATTVIADRAIVVDGRALAHTLREAGITFLQATPSTWRVLLSAGWEGDSNLTALCGGEALPRDLAAMLMPRVGALWNMYGPTETTIWSTIDRVTGDEITIGKPIGNTQAYVLDQNRNWVPRGCLGELWLAGEGVARGYLGRDDLTRERFVANRFTGRGQMYKTGDIVRLRRDGRIEYIGRNDFQVKVRGFRIELGEVQLALTRLPGIQQCVVVVREREPGDAHLVAFYTATGTDGPTVQELRDGLRQSLPEYMVPSWFVPLEKLPLTDNGKINTRLLPDPFAATVSVAARD